MLLAVGFLIGKYRERKRQQGKSLDEYDFYPYASTRENFAEFSLRDFRLGMHYFLRNTDVRAAPTRSCSANTAAQASSMTRANFSTTIATLCV
jgi:hypothetical protein